MYYLAFVRVTLCYFLLLFFQWHLQYSSVSSVNFINTLFDDLEGDNVKLCYIKPDTNSLFLQHPTTHFPLISVPYYLSWPVSLPSARAHTRVPMIQNFQVKIPEPLGFLVWNCFCFFFDCYIVHLKTEFNFSEPIATLAIVFHQFCDALLKYRDMPTDTSLQITVVLL